MGEETRRFDYHGALVVVETDDNESTRRTPIRPHLAPCPAIRAGPASPPRTARSGS